MSCGVGPECARCVRQNNMGCLSATARPGTLPSIPLQPSAVYKKRGLRCSGRRLWPSGPGWPMHALRVSHECSNPPAAVPRCGGRRGPSYLREANEKSSPGPRPAWCIHIIVDFGRVSPNSIHAQALLASMAQNPYEFIGVVRRRLRAPLCFERDRLHIKPAGGQAKN